MSYTTDPQEIGKVKPPELGDGVPYLSETDQRWFSEVEKAYTQPNRMWDGDGYQPDPFDARNRQAVQSIHKVTANHLASITAMDIPAAVERVASRWAASQDK